MRSLRRVFQVLFIFGFFVLFILTTFPLNSLIPVDLFLRIDPLIAFNTLLASHSFLIKMIPSIIVLVITIFLGRIFCGWICPLGTTIDACDKLPKEKLNKKTEQKKYRFTWIKYAVLIAVLTTALFSGPLAGYIDPIALYTRTVVTVFYPLFSFVVQGIFLLLYKVAFLENFLFKIEEILRGTLLPINPVYFQGSMVFAFLILAIFSTAYLTKRFWCRNLCPLGALLALFSRFRIYRRKVSDECTACQLCYKKCRMRAIKTDYKSTDHLECINCMDCQAVCPVDAVHFGFSSKSEKESFDLNRRRILGAGLTGFFTFGLLRIAPVHTVKKGKVIRPPGSWQESAFLDRCIRCGECVRVCSTAGKGLQHAMFESGWEGFATPILLTPMGYCEYNCNLCGQVCPTGAIHPLPLEDKKELKMGTAHFDKTRCIPWYYGEDCLVCEEHCPTPDKAIKFRETHSVTIDGKQTNVMLPYVEELTCIGCGICTTVCPLEGNKGIYLTNTDEVRWEE